MTLYAGDLVHRIEIQERSKTQNPQTGETTVIWTTKHADVPARVTPVSVREFIASRAMNSQITARIVIRYRPDLTADMRILHRNRIYNPQGWLADPDVGLEYLTAPCTEGLNDG